MRLVPLFGFLLGVSILIAGPLRAETPASPEPPDENYKAPAGEAPPVAPPVKKGSPLDHLTNDPKVPLPTAGYKEGNTSGTTYFIAHRHVDEMGGSGWGWVKKNGDDWDSAKWIALQESPGLAIAPFRHLTTHDADDNWEFKFWGRFATYKAYDPHLDEQLPVFILQGYEVTNLANPLSLKVGAPDRPMHKSSGASSRSNRPILSDPGID
jgi:hypothetical protein